MTTTQELIREKLEPVEEANMEKLGRVPTEERNHFQGYMASQMGIKRHSGQKEIDWAEEYGKKIAEIIDFPEESKLKKEVRASVDSGWKDYQESLKSDSEEERQILTEAWTDAYNDASKKMRNTFH